MTRTKSFSLSFIVLVAAVMTVLSLSWMPMGVMGDNWGCVCFSSGAEKLRHCGKCNSGDPKSCYSQASEPSCP
ncbi:hypothetical protein BKA57DRAFT_464161 [Linnemannia elongata]|nr:hypothetical protein BKA57DRAFT_464161 [Linnemannia elongata]KAK5822076.1 hypothetical protein F5H01DRAFT_338600 [Linnemannia elongata]